MSLRAHGSGIAAAQDPADTAWTAGKVEGLSLMLEAMFEREQFQARGSRFTDKVEFVVTAQRLYDKWGDAIDQETVAEELASLEPDDLDGEIVSFDTAIGRGASGSALGIALEGLIYVGGIAGGIQTIHALYKRLRSKFDSVTLSHGAMSALVVYDLLKQRPDLALEDLVLISQDEVRGANGVTELNHTGVDMTFVLLAIRDNTSSWSYLVHCDGRILNFIEGGPLPPEALMYLTSVVEADWDRSLSGPFLGDRRDA